MRLLSLFRSVVPLSPASFSLPHPWYNYDRCCCGHIFYILYAPHLLSLILDFLQRLLSIPIMSYLFFFNPDKLLWLSFTFYFDWNAYNFVWLTGSRRTFIIRNRFTHVDKRMRTRCIVSFFHYFGLQEKFGIVLRMEKSNNNLRKIMMHCL